MRKVVMQTKEKVSTREDNESMVKYFTVPMQRKILKRQLLTKPAKS